MPDYISVQDLLRAATVRVDLQNEPAGSGFFVAPGQVVTCAHVIESAVLASGVEAAGVSVVDSHDVRHDVDLVQRWADERIDLAVLRLRAPAEHLCVLLDPQVRDRDSIDGFGFTKKYPDGVPVTLEVEGQMGAPKRWLKLKNGQVQPGMSGGAAVNVRTGAVCGVLKRSRDEGSDLGGYAVPLSTLFEVKPEFVTANAQVHAADPRWEDLLPADTRRLRRASRRSRSAEVAPETLLVINVGQTSSGWEVSADIHPGGERIDPVVIDLNVVRQQVARLFRDWASSGRVQQQEENGEIALLGGILFNSVFCGEIGERFAQIWAEKKRVAVALRFDDETDSDLIQLPWEHLYFDDATDRHICLARDAGATFSRALERAPATPVVPTRRRIRVTVIAVRPQWDDGSDETNAALAQVDEIVRHLDEIGMRVGNIDFQPMDEEAPDAFAVGEAIGDADVVHYVGFGRFANNADELALGGDAEFGIEYVALSDLARSFEHAEPRLVVLQLLSGRKSEIPADFSVLAPALMKQAPHLPAVLASQYPLTGRLANKFNDALYEQLARGTSVDVAVQEARNKLAWGRLSVSPALFLRRPGDLWLVAPGRDVVDRRSVGAFASNA